MQPHRSPTEEPAPATVEANPEPVKPVSGYRKQVTNRRRANESQLRILLFSASPTKSRAFSRQPEFGINRFEPVPV